MSPLGRTTPPTTGTLRHQDKPGRIQSPLVSVGLVCFLPDFLERRTSFFQWMHNLRLYNMMNIHVCMNPANPLYVNV